MKTKKLEFIDKYGELRDTRFIADLQLVINEETASHLEELVTLRSENETLKQQLGEGWKKYPEEKPEFGEGYMFQLDNGYMLISRWFGGLQEDTGDSIIIAFRELPARFVPEK